MTISCQTAKGWVPALAARIESAYRVSSSSRRSAPSSSTAEPSAPWTPVWISSAEPCVSAVKLVVRPCGRRGGAESIRLARAQVSWARSMTSSSIPTLSPPLRDALVFGAIVAAGIDEAAEELRLGLAVDERLGVPLDADQEAPARVLDRLDRPVGRPGADPQPLAESVDRLVVEGVDVGEVDLGGADDLGQLRARLDLDRVARLGAGDGLAVPDLGREVGEVLVERPAADDVQRLGAAADRQDRHLAGVGAGGDGELETVELRLDRPQLRVRLGFVERPGGGGGGGEGG